jgi:hypothetical protein
VFTRHGLSILQILVTVVPVSNPAIKYNSDHRLTFAVHPQVGKESNSVLVF